MSAKEGGCDGFVPTVVSVRAGGGAEGGGPCPFSGPECLLSRLDSASSLTGTMGGTGAGVSVTPVTTTAAVAVGVAAVAVGAGGGVAVLLLISLF